MLNSEYHQQKSTSEPNYYQSSSTTNVQSIFNNYDGEDSLSAIFIDEPSSCCISNRLLFFVSGSKNTVSKRPRMQTKMKNVNTVL